jgi:hypothetical protein
MRRALVLLGVLLTTSLIGVTPSRAQFGDCTDEYVRSFDVPGTAEYEAWSAGRIQCHEFFRVPVETPDGEIIIRGIGDRNARDLLPAGGMENIEAGVRAARDRLGELGDYDLWDTTILISRARSDPSAPQPRFGYSDAWTLSGASRDGYAECHVTLFIQTDYSPAEIRYVVAHELFHCIQTATLTPGQNATQSGRGLWWIEGSAEWFAAYTAGPQERWARAPGFDQAVAANRALHDMSYRMAIFFYWFHENHGGARAILPFLRQMSEGGSALAQEIAMRAALSEDQWLAFAKAYDDRSIRYPGGGAVHFGQRLEGETWSIEATSNHTRRLKAFVIAVGWANYACGRWENTVSPANLHLRNENNASWSSWPGELDTRDPSMNRRYRIVGLVVDPEAEIEFTLSAARIEACTECIVPAVIDQCLVGQWRLTGGGPAEWLRNQGIPFTQMEQTEFNLTLNDDGTYSTGGFDSAFRAEYPHPRRPMAGGGQATTQATTGRWSAADGELTGCVDSGGESDGMTYVESRRGIGFAPHSGSSPAGASGSTAYTCSDTTFTTSFPMSRGGPMNFEFTRQSPPPRRR